MLNDLKKEFDMVDLTSEYIGYVSFSDKSGEKILFEKLAFMFENYIKENYTFRYALENIYRICEYVELLYIAKKFGISNIYDDLFICKEGNIFYECNESFLDDMLKKDKFDLLFDKVKDKTFKIKSDKKKIFLIDRRLWNIGMMDKPNFILLNRRLVVYICDEDVFILKNNVQ